jgi:PEP-CTERM motif
VIFEEVGNNVLATGGGIIDPTGLSPFLRALPRSRIDPSSALVITGPADLTAAISYRGITGPTSFGSGSDRTADSGSEDIVGIDGTFGVLLVPDGYDSGDPLSNTATYLDETFSSLGVTPGTYVWEWGDGGANQNFTLIIGPTAVPEPASVALLGTALAGLLLIGTIRRIRPGT